MLVMAYYSVILVLSLICCCIYYWKKRNYYSVRYTLIFILAFLSHFCYVLLALSRDVREALIVNKFLYIGGCFFPLVGLFLVFSICKIRFPKWMHFALIAFSCLVYSCVLTAGYLPIFYKSVDLEVVNGVGVLKKEYGPLHVVYIVEIAFFLVATLFALVWGWLKKPEISRRHLAIAAFMQVFSIFAYFIGRAITKDIEWMALADLVDEVGFLIIMDRVGLYSVEDLVSSSILKEGQFGYVSIDLKHRFLNATAEAKKMLPAFSACHADRPVEDEELRKKIDGWIKDLEDVNVSKNHIFRNGDFIYTIRVSDLYDGRRKRGYLLEIMDDTAHQQQVASLESYYRNLNEELKEKDRIIRELRG